MNKKQNKFYHKKLFRITALLIALLYLVQFVPLNFLKEPTIKAFKTATGYDVEITGNIYLRLIPSVKLYLNGVDSHTSNNDCLSAYQANISLSLLSLLTGNLKADGIEFIKANARILDLKSHGENSSIKTITFKESSLELPDDFFLRGKIDNLNASLSFGGYLTTSIHLDASFTRDEVSYSIKVQFAHLDKEGSSKDSSLSISTSTLEIHFIGELINLFSKPNFNGKTEITINGYPNPDNNIQTFSNRLLENEKLTIKGDAILDQNKLEIKDVKISSKNITNASANLAFMFGKAIDFSLTLDVDNFNLDQSIKELDEANHAISIPLEGVAKNFIEGFNFHMSPYVTGNIFINIGQVPINQKNISNINVVLDFFDGEVSLSKLNFIMPGESLYSMEGIILHNGIRPKMDGQINLTINKLKDFGEWIGYPTLHEMLKADNIKIKSRLEIMPRNLHLSDFKTIYGNTYALGKYSLKSTGEKKMTTKLSLRFNNVDMDDYKISTSLDQVIYNLFALDNDKSGQYFLEYTNDFKWLREFPVNLTTDLNFEQLQFKGKTLTGIQTTFRMQPNKINIEKFSIADNQIPMSATGSLLLTALNPEINLDLKFQRYDTSLFGANFPSLPELQSYQQTYFKTLAENRKEAQILPENFYSKDINLFSSHNFTGNIRISFDALKSPNLSANDIDLKLGLNEGSMDVTTFTGNAFGGNFEVIGSLSNMSSKVSTSSYFAFNNFNPEEFFKFFFDTPMLEGYLSASGKFSGTGQDIRSTISSSNGSINFIGKKMLAKSFGLGELIKLTEIKLGKNKTDEALRYYSTQGQTTFNDLSGSIVIKNGIAAISDSRFSNNRTSGTFIANVDLANWQINGLGKISFYPMGKSYPLSLGLAAKGDMHQQFIAIDTSPIEAFIQTRDSASNPPKQ